MTDKEAEELPTNGNAPELGNLFRDLAQGASSIEELDARTRANLKLVGDRLCEESRRAHAGATTDDFELVEDPYGQHGVYGHLGVSPNGLYLATRRERDDILDGHLGPDGERLYDVLSIEDWPVPWLRRISRERRVDDLAEALLTRMRALIESPDVAVPLPHDMQAPTPPIVEVATSLSFPAVVGLWRDAQRNLATSTPGALRAACALLESVCKHVLSQREQPLPKDLALTHLYKTVAKELKFNDHERVLASGLRAVVEGIAHGRSHLSDAHGEGPNATKPTLEHAELAVAAAGLLATHLMKKLKTQPA